MNDNYVSLEEFWKVIMRLNADVARCMTMLHATAESDKEGQAFWRRMYARAVLALIDAAVYGMIFQAFAGRNRPDVTFSFDELRRLETAYDFDEDLEPPATVSKTQMLDDIRFAINAIGRVHHLDFIILTHDPSWVLVKEIAHIRVRLQYAREPDELEIHEENIDTLVEGLRWLLEQMVEVFKGCVASMSTYKTDQDSEDELAM